MFFHVRFELHSRISTEELKADMTQEELETRILTPYGLGEPIIINGRTIRANDIERIQITQSDVPTSDIIPILEREDRNSSVVVLGGPSYEWRAAGRSADVTDEYIKGPPGYLSGSRETALAPSKPSDDSVLVVHGHDHALKTALEAFLRELGLNPVVLHRQPDEGLTVIEKFERHSEVPYAFVILTPDDVAYSNLESAKPEETRNLELRARQNVVFEMGYFAGKLGRANVCCIYKSGVTLPSDLAGLIYKPVAESIEEIGYSLIKELQAAGLKPHVGNR